MWAFFWWSGCREGEVSHAEWCDLDFRKNVLHVQPDGSADGSKTKTL